MDSTIPRDGRNCLIGKVILDNESFTEASVKSLTSLQWRCKKDYKVSHIKSNIFLFSFQENEDFGQVLSNSPYTIRGGLLVLSLLIYAQSESHLSHSPCWVQVHGLPYNCVSKEDKLKISEILGKPVCLNGEVYEGKLISRNFLRLRVILDITKPLIPGIWQRRSGQPDRWLEFKYEKLGLFCYKCGRIGKDYKNCEFPEGEAYFGHWMRAEPLDNNNRPRWPSDNVRRGGSSPVSGGESVVRSGRSAEGNGNRFACLADMDDITDTVIPVARTEMRGKVESEEMLHWSADNADDVPRRFLLQRQIMNTLAAAIMVANCLIISARVSASKAWENNWNLLVLVASYLLYLVMMFVQTIRRLWLSKAPSSDATLLVKDRYDCDTNREILVLLLVFLLLEFCLSASPQ